MLLTADDIAAAGPLFATSDAVLVQLQQPAEATLAAARRGADAGALVVLDGAPPAEHREALLAAADVVRADTTEAELLTGVPADDPQQLLAAARSLLDVGPSVVALALTDGNLFVWRDAPGSRVESLVLPLGDDDVVDTTGGGDAFVAALTVALLRGDPVPAAARRAVAASAATVGYPGGRPDLRGLTWLRAGIDVPGTTG
ncbi:PfkB family carbohydrate kinase [Dactylosporangium sp. NPDC049525]|uniref:PfkB family carbohydrate kinase n=1 Tax=Dactylosporangium sp. NPDC049525 TaxID=3154730 RepID=UPI003423DC80